MIREELERLKIDLNTMIDNVSSPYLDEIKKNKNLNIKEDEVELESVGIEKIKYKYFNGDTMLFINKGVPLTDEEKQKIEKDSGIRIDDEFESMYYLNYRGRRFYRLNLINEEKYINITKTSKSIIRTNGHITLHTKVINKDIDSISGNAKITLNYGLTRDIQCSNEELLKLNYDEFDRRY